jgi:tryptophan synthase alpha chain
MTYELALECIATGADVLELGIPFSDPMADGPTIQSAAHRALLAGTKVADIFATVKRIRAVNDIPIVFLVYYNTICRRGEQNFISACADSGVDGLVIPDLPVEESGSIRNLAGANGIDIIQLIAPASTIDRIIGAAKVASGFIGSSKIMVTCYKCKHKFM